MKKLITLVAAVTFSATAIFGQELANFQRQQRVVSPEIQNDSVIFRINANYATVVNCFLS